MKRRNRNILLCLLIALMVLVIALMPTFLATHHEEKQVELAFNEYANYLVSERFDKAYASCGTEFRSATPYDSFVSTYKSLQDQYGSLKSAKLVAYEVHGNGSPIIWRAVVDADLAYETTTLRFEFVFHKEGDRWVLFGAEHL